MKIAAVIALALAGCAYMESAGVRDIASMAVRQTRGQVWTVRIDRRCGQVADFVQAKEAVRMVAVCDSKCNCRLVKGSAPKPESGICR